MLINILPEIFMNLPMKDVLKSRQVCRAWRCVVDQGFLKELCLYVRGTYAPDVWVIDCKLIDPRTVLTVHHLNVLSDPNFIQMFRNLKRLMIKYPRNERESGNSNHLNHLNQLDHMEHLELHGMPVGKDFELKLKGLKKFFYDRATFADDFCYAFAHPLPQSLETLGLYDWSSGFFKGMDHLKVLISRDYSEAFLQLTNLEQLHLTYLMEDEKRPIMARFPRLLLLNIHQSRSKKSINKILREIESLKPARNLKFYHEGIDISIYTSIEEKRRNLQKSQSASFSIDLKKMLSVAQQNPNMVLPFSYFETSSIFCKDWPGEEVYLTRPYHFGILKGFSINVKKLAIEEVLSSEEMRSLLANFRHLLSLTFSCEVFDERFLEDLPRILENLICLTILDCFTFDGTSYISTKSEAILESLDFLKGFKRLLSFEAKFLDNEKNQKIIESIEERKKSLTYPLVANSPSVNELHLDSKGLRCINFLRS